MRAPTLLPTARGELHVARTRARAMGTDLHLVVVAPGDRADTLLADAHRRIDELECRWSRFLSTSDVGRLNATRGLPVAVHPDTRRLVRTAVLAWELSEGAYDPTVLDALCAAGYDRPFEQLTGEPSAAPLPPPAVDGFRPAPGCAGIEVDDELGTVTLPPDAGFDPGGIGKGLAADIVVSELLDAGAAGALVNLGGDLRVAGTPPTGEVWGIEVAEPTVADRPLARLALTEGAVATSTTRRRRWRSGGRSRHHVIDPRTGRPAETRAVLATVVAGDAWWAEVAATRLLTADPVERDTIVGDGAALVVERDGGVHRLGSLDRFVCDSGTAHE